MKRIFKINKKSFCVSTAVIMLFLSIVPGAPSWFGLIDDVIPLIFGIIWCVHFVTQRRIGKERNLFILLLSVCAIGLVSNLISGLAKITPIVLDLFSFLKMFFVYLLYISMELKKSSLMYLSIKINCCYTGKNISSHIRCF